MSMHTLQVVRETDALLEELPTVREILIRVSSQALHGEDIAQRDRDRILRFLDDAERSEDDLALVEYIFDQAEAGRPTDEADLAAVLEVIEEAALDLNGLLVERVAGGEIEDTDYRELEREFIQFLEQPPQEDREDRLETVRDFIYDSPGHYVKKIYRRLKSEGMYGFTYQTLLNDIYELQDREEIMTVGDRQGVPKFCFPNPRRIQDRQGYFGQLYPVQGEVESEVSNSFRLQKAMAEVYVVNHHVDPIMLVLPLGSNLDAQDEVEGFGKLHPLAFLESKMPRVGGIPEDVEEVVLAEHVKRMAPDPQLLKIPSDFRYTFGL